VRPALPRPRPLGELADLLPGARWAGPAPAGREVTGATLDSRAVQAGDLYAAVPGARVHGAEFVPAVVAAGATAILTDAAGEGRAVAGGRPVVVVPDVRAVLGPVAGWAYDEPARDLDLIGVTGTNGKTTTAYLLEAGLRAAGRVTGLIGTIETHLAGTVVPSVRTTPEAPELQALLAVMRERGVGAVAMEVSSHALALGRVDGIRFAVAVFTNLSQDHLDFHGDMAAYYAAKASLFTPARAEQAVIVVDDAAGQRLAGEASVPVLTCSTTPGQAADWTAYDVRPTPTGSAFTARGPAGEAEVALQLPGAFNVANALAALAALVALGIPLGAAAAGISALAGVPGRMERVDAGQPFLALVDYAHTPQAVGRLLAAVRSAAATGRVLVVLGCGGDRDAGKRPQMGAAAARGADLAVLTSDNPRSEDPLTILAAMAAGAQALPAGQRGEVVVEPDRARAIALAAQRALPGDVLVVAGKGHETGQEIAGVVTPFDDRDVLRRVLGPAGSRA
jgi:UDP-N-acetylmuramoyl-L-alanyl-D-glutamate--2,6-diaminopimelate ligase